MGFPCICHAIIIPKPLAILLCIFQRICFAIAAVLSYVGLRVLPEFSLSPWTLEAYPNPLAAASTAAVIKGRLPVVEFGRFVERHKRRCTLDLEPTCVVCLGWLEAKDEMRELGSCNHTFHKACIDGWVDLGHVTCPLCRLQLLPLGSPGRVWRSFRALLRLRWTA